MEWQYVPGQMHMYWYNKLAICICRCNFPSSMREKWSIWEGWETCTPRVGAEGGAIAGAYGVFVGDFVQRECGAVTATGITEI